MVTRRYSDLTIKKLYSRAGNICSHPDCNQQLIADDGTNLSDISHIEGGEPGSPRYNPELTLEQLNDYKNLIVLCKIHNKIIDSNEKTYTVEHLKEMKKKHEDSMKDKDYQISDELIGKIIQEAGQAQINIQNGSGIQIIAQGDNVIQKVGITSIVDAERLFGILFKQNFPKIQEEAQRVAEERAEKYCKSFIEKANSQLSEDDIKKMSEPDVQYILTKSIIDAGRKDDDELRENLSRLLVERIKHSDQNLKCIVYNEAIETIPKLTPDELKIIALCFILKYARWENVFDVINLENSIGKLKPLLDFNNTNAEFQHIVYAGCGELGLGSWSYEKAVQEAYPNLSLLTISKNRLSIHNIPEEVKNDLFTKIDDSEFEFKIKDRKLLDDYLNSKNLVTVAHNSILTEFDSAKNKAAQYIKNLLNDSYVIREVIKLISESNLKHLTLTSVGIVIGAMYYGKITGEKVPIDIWIN